MYSTSAQEISRIDTAAPQPITLGSFAETVLRRAGVWDIVERIARGEPLTPLDGAHLTRVSLPVLSKLVEFRRSFERQPIVAYLRPLLHLALGDSVARLGSQQGAAVSLECIESVLAQNTFPKPLFVSLDRWVCPTQTSEDFFSALKQLSSSSKDRFRILGPSTGEIKAMVPTNTNLTLEESVAGDILPLLKRAGIANIEGGGDLRIHSLAAEAGFRLSYAHNLARIRLNRSTSTPSEKSFIDEMSAAREQLVPYGSLDVWSPWSSATLDSVSSRTEAPLGLEMIKSIALARLFFAEVPYIRAPLSLMGARAVELAYQLGANDFGFSAVDQQTSEHLGLLSYQTATEHIQVHLKKPSLSC